MESVSSENLEIKPSEKTSLLTSTNNQQSNKSYGSNEVTSNIALAPLHVATSSKQVFPQPNLSRSPVTTSNVASLKVHVPEASFTTHIEQGLNNLQNFPLSPFNSDASSKISIFSDIAVPTSRSSPHAVVPPIVSSPDVQGSTLKIPSTSALPPRSNGPDVMIRGISNSSTGSTSHRSSSPQIFTKAIVIPAEAPPQFTNVPSSNQDQSQGPSRKSPDLGSISKFSFKQPDKFPARG